MNIIGWYEPYAGIVVCVDCLGSDGQKGWIEIRAVEASEASTCDCCSAIIYGYGD